MFVLKQLRRKKRINQTDLANAIGVSLRTIQLYEKKNANIPIKNLTKIAEYFEVTIAELYSQEVNEEEVVYGSKFQNSTYLIKPIGTKKNIISIPLVTSENYSQYCREFQNEDFLSKLPVISFMIKDAVQGNLMAFEIVGSSMENDRIDGILNGSIVLGKEVPLENLTLNEKYKNSKAVIIYGESILCKELVRHDEKNETITCHSLNTSPEYADFEIPLNQIKQFFKVIKKQMD
ncbi:XRE family transcriptional regulator [Maribacter sp. 2308TA10-17]|uniref:XRE family transcriptional regulator n=1 Tax=Maribacter sp. 2308TA10-17 TaxID=3386276 RepID=UPI0039BC5621